MTDQSMDLTLVFLPAVRAIGAIGVASLLLVGCGGGSGSGSSSSQVSPPPAPETVPFKLTGANMRATGELAVSFSEALLQVTQLVIDAIDQTRINQIAASTTICENGARANYTLTDQNNDGVPNAGDAIRVSYFSCYQSSIDDVANGDLVITLTNPASTTGWDGAKSYAATVQFQSGFGIGGLPIHGTLNVAAIRDGFKSTATATSTAADDWSVVARINGVDYVEAAKSVQVSKLIDYIAARTYPSLSLTYQSQVLGGSLTINTKPTLPLSSYIGTYPDQGLIDITGANQDLLRFVPRVFPGNSTNDVYLYLAGNTQVTAVAQTTDSWSNFVSGFMWWDPRVQPTVMSQGYLSKELDLSDLSVLFSQPAQVGALIIDPPYYIQFSHQLDQTKLLPTPTLTTSNSTVIPVSMGVIGARVTIFPQQTLTRGDLYTLTFDAPFFDQNVSSISLNPMTFAAK